MEAAAKIRRGRRERWRGVKKRKKEKGGEKRREGRVWASRGTESIQEKNEIPRGFGKRKKKKKKEEEEGEERRRRGEQDEEGGGKDTTTEVEERLRRSVRAATSSYSSLASSQASPPSAYSTPPPPPPQLSEEVSTRVLSRILLFSGVPFAVGLVLFFALLAYARLKGMSSETRPKHRSPYAPVVVSLSLSLFSSNPIQ